MVCCPYGGVVALPIIFSMVGVGLTMAYTFSCHFFESSGLESMGITRGYGPWTIQGTYPIRLGSSEEFVSYIEGVLTGNITKIHDIDLNMTDTEKEEMSEFFQEDGQQICYPWSQYGYDAYEMLFDSNMNLARGFSMTSTVLSLLLMFTILFMGCCRFRKCSFYFTGVLCILTGVFSAVTFLSTRTAYCQDAEKCTIGSSGIVCIVAVVWWILLGIFLMCLEKTPVNERQNQPSTVAPAATQQQQTETYSQDNGVQAATVVTTNAGRDAEKGGATTVVY